MIRAQRNRGVVLPLFAVALLALLGIAGLAIDLGHAYSAKSELQNALDAAALAGAKVLNQTGSVAESQSAALTVYSSSVAKDVAGTTPVFEVSPTLIPFVPGGTEPRYVRVRLPVLPVATTFARVLPGVGDALTVGGSAVAGPMSVTPCDVAPILVCAETTASNCGEGAAEGETCIDTDCSDGDGDGIAECFGFSVGEESEVLLKYGAPGGEIGPGNFQLIQLGCGAGADCVRDNLAGIDDNYNSCVQAGESVSMDTAPGNKYGPVRDGIETRIQRDYVSEVGIWNGPYRENYPSSAGPNDCEYGSDCGKYVREVTLPFGDCSTAGTGQTSVDIAGFGCFFLTDYVEQGGQSGVKGQFIGDCESAGGSTQYPSGANTYKIVLYKDPDSSDS